MTDVDGGGLTEGRELGVEVLNVGLFINRELTRLLKVQLDPRVIRLQRLHDIHQAQVILLKLGATLSDFIELRTERLQGLL